MKPPPISSSSNRASNVRTKPRNRHNKKLITNIPRNWLKNVGSRERNLGGVGISILEMIEESEYSRKVEGGSNSVAGADRSLEMVKESDFEGRGGV